jgi:hypothetical protein
MRLLLFVASCVLAAASSVSLAAPAAAPAMRAEINALLDRLQASGCEFNRNGSWHGGPQAKAHLLKKLDYLEGKNAVQGTEQFIELAAATSSSSGKPYLVRCGDAAPVPSKQWLTQELNRLRAARP